MKDRFRSIWMRAGVAAVAVVATGVGVLAPGAAGQGDATASTANTVLITGSKKSPLKFVAPKTIVEGESLTIINKSIPKQIGPHTLSLVEESLEPDTKPERKKCFTPGHICKAIADWHGVKGEGPPTKNPANAGKPGLDTEGTLSKPGDSWFTGEEPGGKITEKVTADTSDGPTTLHFICAIHPWMKGSIEVLPKG